MAREQRCKGQMEMFSTLIFSLRQSVDFLSVGNMLCLHTEAGVRDSKFRDPRKQVLGHVVDRDLRLTRALGSRCGIAAPPLPHQGLRSWNQLPVTAVAISKTLNLHLLMLIRVTLTTKRSCRWQDMSLLLDKQIQSPCVDLLTPGSFDFLG